MAVVLRFVSMMSHENVLYLAYLYMYMYNHRSYRLRKRLRSLYDLWYNAQVYMVTADNPLPCNRILRASFIGVN